MGFTMVFCCPLFAKAHREQDGNNPASRPFGADGPDGGRKI
jgi:hypothetical protein